MRRTFRGSRALQSPRNVVNAMNPFTKKYQQMDSGRPISNQDAEGLRREINLLKLRLQKEFGEKKDLQVKLKILEKRLKSGVQIGETKVDESTPAGNALRAARAQKRKATIIGPGTSRLKADYPNNDTIVPELYEKLRDLEERFRVKEQELQNMKMSSQQSNQMEMKLMLFEYYQETQRLRKFDPENSRDPLKRRRRRKKKNRTSETKRERGKKRKGKRNFKITTPYGSVTLPTIYIENSGAPTLRPGSATARTDRPVAGSGSNALQALIRARDNMAKTKVPIRQSGSRTTRTAPVTPRGDEDAQKLRPTRYHTFEEVDGAALMIQNNFRGFRVRNETAKWHRAGTAINRCARGHLDRKRYHMMRREQAAIKINAVARGYLARKQCRREHEAATSIQCLFRRRTAAGVLRGLRREHAASIIQRNYRWTKLLYEAKRDRAARVITNVFRCQGPIKLLKQLKMAAVCINRRAMRFLRNKAAKRKAGVKWRSLYRRYRYLKIVEAERARQREADRNYKATKVQSIFRMHAAKKIYKAEQEKRIARINREKAAMKEADDLSRAAALYAQELRNKLEQERREQEERERRGEQAVLTLQARYRGYKGRQKAAVQRQRYDAAVKLQSLRRSRAQRQRFSRMKKAATWVQTQLRRVEAQNIVKQMIKDKWALFSQTSLDWASRDLQWEDKDEIAHLDNPVTSEAADADKDDGEVFGGLSTEFKYQWDAEGGTKFIQEDAADADAEDENLDAADAFEY